MVFLKNDHLTKLKTFFKKFFFKVRIFNIDPTPVKPHQKIFKCTKRSGSEYR